MRLSFFEILSLLEGLGQARLGASLATALHGSSCALHEKTHFISLPYSLEPGS